MRPRPLVDDAPPIVRSREKASQLAEPARPRIEIEAGPKPGAPSRSRSSNPERFWLDYYRTHDETPADLQEKITLLNVNKKFRDVRAVLWGYLKYHSRNAEPWMYSALALAIKMNGGQEKDVKQALGYAADLAIRSRNPNHLVSVADQSLLLGYTDRVGPLLDQAADLVPHRGEPLMMSINLARKTQDPKRMGDAITRLLSLGWPGLDDIVRRQARTQAETLARSLREDARTEEADALLALLPDAEARDLFIRLTWIGDAGLDLAVEEPLGATARVLTPRTVFGGSIVKDGYGSHPEEVYVCPRAFDGVYSVRVETAYNNPEKPALEARLEIITHEGTAEEHKEVQTVTIPREGKPSAPIKVTLKGGRRKQALPFLAPSTPLPASLAGTARRTRPASPPPTTGARPDPKNGASRSGTR
ncbi:MAG: hypothetical protein NVSMB9_17350 [Isosphaeraceae bacterium]